MNKDLIAIFEYLEREKGIKLPVIKIPGVKIPGVKI